MRVETRIGVAESCVMNLRKIFGSPSTRIREALVEAEAAVAAAKADEAALRTARAGLVADPVELARNREATRAAAERTEDAELVVSALASRLAEVEHSEKQVQLRAAYEAARIKGEAAQRLLRNEYTKLVAAMVILLTELSSAQVAVEAANAALPENAQPILDPEFAVRATAAQERQIVKDEEIVAWRSVHANRPAEDQRANYASNRLFVKSHFRQIEFYEFVPGTFPSALRAMVRLPSLRSEGYAWGNAPSGYSGELAALAAGVDTPATALQVAKEREGWQTAPIAPKRVLKVEYELLDDVAVKAATGLGLVSASRAPTRQAS